MAIYILFGSLCFIIAIYVAYRLFFVPAKPTHSKKSPKETEQHYTFKI